MRNLHIFSDESMPNTPNQTPTSNQKAFTQSKTPNTPKIHQICQKKNQLCQKTPNMQKKHQILQNTPNFHLRCFIAKNFLFQIHALFGVLFTGLKSMVVYQKGQI